MKYKNYINNHTKDNRIYSSKEIADMSVREVFKKKDAIMSQHSQIGISSEKELQASDNVVYVKAYTREDGTEVKTHWRSLPDGIESNNLSFRSPQSSGTPTGGASEVDVNSAYKDYTTGEPIVDVSTPEKVQKLMYPDEIAGVKRGKEMTLEQASGKSVNPNYGSGDERFEKVCQSSVACWEARIRGYDLEVLPYNEVSAELASNPWDVFVDPKTGKSSVPTLHSGYTQEECAEILNEHIKPGERYMVVYSPNESSRETHAVCSYKTDNGDLHIYDAMTGEEYKPEEFVKKIKPSTVFNSQYYPMFSVRIDDKILDNKIMQKITKPKTST
ncbi:hypothetical protein IKQ21_09840 [bacterium]|nr:hypothetical protein [bacterium]